MSLSDEQREAIQRTGALPLEIADQQTNQVFFLISAEQYRRARRIIEGIEEIDPSLYEIEDVNLTDAP